MRREQVISSCVVSVGYDGTSQTLEIDLRNGIYKYHSVPQSIYDKFMKAESKGKFFHAYIRKSYRYTKL